jgi:hypothetical protein
MNRVPEISALLRLEAGGDCNRPLVELCSPTRIPLYAIFSECHCRLLEAPGGPARKGCCDVVTHVLHVLRIRSAFPRMTATFLPIDGGATRRADKSPRAAKKQESCFHS